MSATPEAAPSTPSYVTEYRDAFASIPFTNEDTNGVITDVRTGQVVETPATHPDYRARYGSLVTARSVATANTESREHQYNA